MNEQAKQPEQSNEELQKKDAVKKDTTEKGEAPAKQSPEKVPAAAVPAEGAKEAKGKKKINRLTLKELEKKLQDVQEKMGGLSSAYAQQLLSRKEQLVKKPETQNHNL